MTLAAVAPEELREFLASFEPRYIEERMRADGLARPDAERFVAEQWAALLPRGTDTPGHRFFWALDPASGARLGLLWLFIDERPRLAFLYQIEIYEPHRRQGHGRRLLAAAEQAARRAGARALSLNVFAGNDAAIALYRSAGYAVASHGMSKPLES